MNTPLSDQPWRDVQARARQLRDMSNGQFGSFFDALSTDCDTAAGSLFPRLVRMLQQKKQDWASALPVCTNYFRAICQIITDFSLGEGARLSFDVPNAASYEFAQWWQAQQIDSTLSDMLAQAISTGTAGVQLQFDSVAGLVPQVFGLEEYHPAGDAVWGYDHEQPTLGWVLRDGDTEYLFRHVFVPQPDGHYVLQAAVNDYDTRTGEIGTALPERLAQITRGVSSEQYTVLPLVLMHSPRRGEHGLGQSFFADILAQVQTLCFLDTVASVELQTHFLSKLAIPRSLVTTDPAGRPRVAPLEYIVYEDDGQLPQFIQKDNKFFDDLLAHAATMKESIALSTGVPYELLSKEGRSGDEKVQLAQIRQRPFRQVIRAWQRVLRRSIEQIYDAWWALTQDAQTPKPSLRVLLPDGFIDSTTELRAALLDEYRAGLISARRFVKLTNPELNEAEVNAVVDDAAPFTPPVTSVLPATSDPVKP